MNLSRIFAALWVALLLSGPVWASQEVLLSAQLGHAGWVTSVSFSPDGKTLISGSTDTTLKLWDVLTGLEIRTLSGHSNEVTSSAFSPDGRLVVSGSSDNDVRLWSVATGQEMGTLSGHSEDVASVAFSPDGKTVLSGSRDNTVKIWDVATGSVIRTLTGHAKGVEAVAFSPDGTRIASASRDQTVRLWRVSGKENPVILRGHDSWVRSVAFSADGITLVSGGYDDSVRLWSVKDARELKTMSGHQGSVESVVFSADGKTVISGSGDKTLKLWDAGRGEAMRTLSGHDGWVRSVAISPDGKTIASASYDQLVKLWDIASGEEVRALRGYVGAVQKVALSPDGKMLATTSRGGRFRLWDLAAGAESKGLDNNGNPVEGFWFSPDSKSIITDSPDDALKLWEASSGRLIGTLAKSADFVSFQSFSSDGRSVVVACKDNTLKVLDLSSGKQLHSLKGRLLKIPLSPDGKTILQDRVYLVDVATGNTLGTLGGQHGRVDSSVFSTAGDRVFSGSSNGTVILWDTATGAWLAKLVSFADGTWAVVDPEGRYDATEGGNVQGLHWVVDNEPIELAQLKERYYEPGLLAKIMGFNKDPLHKLEAFASLALFPAVQVTPPSDKSAAASVRLTNRGGGIGRVRILVNGKEIASDARGPRPDPEAGSVELPVQIPDSLLEPSGDNTIQVLAWNGEGYLSSRGEPVHFRTPPAPKVEPVTMYAIVSGISKYANPSLDLTYSGKDGADLARALSISAGRLFGAEKVNISLLTDYSDPETPDPLSAADGIKRLPPTRENLEWAFSEARMAKAGDILLVYLAGHGVMSSGEGSDYYYLTSGARSTDLSDPAVRRESGISSAELTEWIKQIPALKQVMVLDTCAAGGAVAKLVEQRALTSDQIRSLERLKDRTGFHVLMGAAADKASLEATQYGQGLLTWAILQGIKGAALRDGQYVDVQKLFQHAADEVPRLAKSVGGIQKPLIASPKGNSFDIGQVTADDKVKIPLATVKPMILKASFLSAVPPKNDALKLSSLINAALREQSANPRGSGIVFVDAEELPGAFIISGDYRKNGDRLTVEAYVTSGETQQGSFTLIGTTADLAGLAREVVNQAEELVRK